MPWPKGKPRPDVAERMRARCVVTAQGCWEWQGARDKRGYGRLTFANRSWLVHRLMFALTNGFDVLGPALDHLCRNHACINPAHLESVTVGENTRRGLIPNILRARGAAVTHCPQGHEYTPENTRRSSGGWRECGICRAARHRRYRQLARNEGARAASEAAE